MLIESDPLMIKLALLICLLIALYVYLGGILSFYGSLAALVMGMVIILFTDIFFFIVLLLFLLFTHRVTIWKYDLKKERGFAEGKSGERGVKNVLSNGIVAIIVALLYVPLNKVCPGLPNFLFLLSVASAAADSFASEIGVLSDNVYLITRPRERVMPGTDGGVSTLGHISAFMGSVLVVLPGFFLLSDYLDIEKHGLPFSYVYLITLVALAWVNSQIDSLLGATLQRNGIIGNNGVNVLSISLTTLLGAIIYCTIHI
ncbi:MAG: DUF92 domain-containing protein [Thermoplasmata archaeon]|nr:DUF92 domain-containing protein [Thermoplasmata archaeon]